MFWSDQIIDAVNGKVIINDSKTLSGRAHVGSLRGPVVHDLVYRTAQSKKREADYLYGSDDYDALDAVPPYLSKDVFSQHLGKPLVNVPSPDAEEENFSVYYMKEFTEVFNRLGVYPTYHYKVSELYKEGKFNNHIQTVLENFERIQQIYFEASGSQKERNWIPFQVICEKCGKIATTTVTKYNGKTILYVCEKNKVNYTEGCGHVGEISPFNGTGKLPWKLEWAAKWGIFNVTVEGAGIDHSVAGGSRSVAEAISKDIFKRKPPVNIPYEFMLIESKKMSSSKGIGYSAIEVLDYLPPELLRFLLAKTAPQSAINFSLDGDSILRLFDTFDAYKDRYFGVNKAELDENEKKVFELSQITSPTYATASIYSPRLTYVSTLIQVPEIDVLKKLNEQKGSDLTTDEIKEYEKRAKYANQWLRQFAPENYVFQISKGVPQKSKILSEEQKTLLVRISSLLENQADKPYTGDDLHNIIHELSKEIGIKAVDAFSAIYIALLDRNSGPKAGNLIAALDRKFVINRFKSISSYVEITLPPISVRERKFAATFADYFQISNEVYERFPSLMIGVAVIEGLTVTETNHDLTILKNEVYQKLRNKYNASDLSTLPLINEYRRIYKAFGVDPRSRVPSAEALVKRVLNGHDIYTINSAVDAYNISSAEYFLPMAMYDTDKIEMPVNLRFSEEGEEHKSIGATSSEKLKQGELVYADQCVVMCRDFNYKDSDITKVTSDTKNAILFVDGCNLIAVNELEEVLYSTIQRIVRFAGGKVIGQAILYKEEGKHS